MAKYLDDSGVTTLWAAVKEQDATNLQAAKNYADGLDNAMDARMDTVEGYFTGGVANEAAKATKDGSNNTIETTYVKRAHLGVATPSGANPAYTGVATLGTDGKIPSAQLPGFVDDVVEGYYYQNKFYEESAHTTEITGEGGKIYLDLSTNKCYRWGGSAYAEVSSALAIGTTQGTAYDGAAGAQLASDVSDLQTAVTTTIPATYVPITSGTNKGVITNDTTNIEMIYGNTSSGHTEFTQTDSQIIIKYKSGTSAVSTISISTHGIAILGDTLKWNTKVLAKQEEIKVDTIKINGTALTPSSKAVDILTNTAYDATNNKIATMSDITVDSIETTGDGNAITAASLSSKKITFTKGSTFLTSHQGIKTLKTDNTSAQTASSSEAINGSGTINLHKVSKTGSYNDLNDKLVTNSTYNASTNKIATMSDVPSVQAITAQELAAILV